MTVTYHAHTRRRERGISQRLINRCIREGRIVSKLGETHVVRRYLSLKQIPKWVPIPHKARGLTTITSTDNDTVITAYWEN